MLGADKFAAVMRQMENLRNSSEAVRKAFELVPKDTAADMVTEEALGYLAEIAPKHSVMRQIMAAVKAFLFKHFGLNEKYLTEAAMISLLQSSLNKVNREAGMVGGRVFEAVMPSTASDAVAASREYLSGITPTSVFSGLKNLLPHNAVKSLADHLPGVSDALGAIFSTPTG